MIGRRWHLPILAAAVLTAGSLLVSSPGSAEGAGGACSGTTGVTVVVDYQALGGGVVVACAAGSAGMSGFDALKQAGFQIAQVAAIPQFLCRIDGKPADDPCQHTPPASAYWSYWHAERGGTWKYNPEGGYSSKPPPGSVDGWSFSDDGTPGGAAPPPGMAPPAPSSTPKPTPKPTARPTATPRPTPKPPATITPRPTTTPRGSPDPSRQPSSAAPSRVPSAPASSTPPSPSPTAAGSGPPSAEPTPSKDPPSATPVAGTESGGTGSTTASGGPPLGTLVGLGLVVVIGAAALTARGRRSARDPGDG